MKNRRFLAILVSVVLAGSLLAGCGGSKKEEAAPAAEEAVEEEAAKEEEKEAKAGEKEAEKEEEAEAEAVEEVVEEEAAEADKAEEKAEEEKAAVEEAAEAEEEAVKEEAEAAEEAAAEEAEEPEAAEERVEKEAEDAKEAIEKEAEAAEEEITEEAEAAEEAIEEEAAAAADEEAEEAPAKEDAEKEAPAEEEKGEAPAKEEKEEAPAEEEKEEAPAKEEKEEAPAEEEEEAPAEEEEAPAAEAEEEEVVAADSYKIGFSQATMASPFYVTMVDEFENYCKEKGVEPMAISADEDVQKQNQDIMDMIAAGIDALILNPINLESVQTGIDACVDAEIPVITVDRMASSGGTAVVKRDNYEMGRLTGEALLEALGGDKAEGTILELQGTAGDQVMMDRRDGFESVFEDVEGIAIVRSVNCDYVRAKALTAAQDMIQGNDDIVAIYGHNDDMAMGGLQAAQEAGLKDVLVCGVDGLMEAVEAIANGEGYVATTLNDPGTELKVAADTALKVLNGEPFEQEVDAGTGLIDTSNAADYVDENLSFAAMKDIAAAAIPTDADLSIGAVEEEVKDTAEDVEKAAEAVEEEVEEAVEKEAPAKEEAKEAEAKEDAEKEAPAKEEAKEAEAKEDAEKEAPAEEEKEEAPAKEEKEEAPAKEEKEEAPAEEEKEEAPAKEEKEEAPAKEEKEEAPADEDVVAAESYKIGFSQATMASPFYVTMVDEFEHYCKEKGVEPMAISADEDVQKQNQDIMDMIAAGIDALILNPINLESVQTGIDACVDAEIPVITVDRMASSGGTAVVKRDNYEMGRLTGEALLEALGGADKAEGTILELQGTAGDQVMMDRRDGFESVFKDVKGIKIVQSVNCDYVRAKALTAAQDMIQGNDDIVAIYGHNDDMAMGGLQAAQEAGLEGVLVCGVDGLMEAVEAIANGEGYVATTLNDPGTELRVAADTALKVLNGEDYEEEVDAGTGLVDTSNAADYVDDRLSFAAMK